MRKLRVGILGATGMVGQQFLVLLQNHPWFDVVVLAASRMSAGKTYKDAVANRWKLEKPLPEQFEPLIVCSVTSDSEKIAAQVDLVFSALDMDKAEIQQIEEHYASLGIPVVSNNSAHRWTADIPMIMPEINSEHLEIILVQQKNRGWKKGFIVVKPNCSIQSYVTILTALKKFGPQKVRVTSMQAISGAGKTFVLWPEMVDNLIPYIGGEEEKSEKEPMKIWGSISNGEIQPTTVPHISATCIRVPVTNGHMASVAVTFAKKPTKAQIIAAVKRFNPLAKLALPSSPKQLIQYFSDETRPQTKVDRIYEQGMGISMGRLREDTLCDFSFVALSHNTIRGAAGGAILTAELLYAKNLL